MGPVSASLGDAIMRMFRQRCGRDLANAGKSLEVVFHHRKQPVVGIDILKQALVS